MTAQDQGKTESRNTMMEGNRSTEEIGGAPISGWVQRAFERMLEERLTVIAAFRAEFAQHGLDVTKYSDEEISHAILVDSESRLSCRERLARAFHRLTTSTNGRRPIA